MRRGRGPGSWRPTARAAAHLATAALCTPGGTRAAAHGPAALIAKPRVRRRSLETLVKSVEDHASDTSTAAVQAMQGVCSDQMLKRQMQSLKASFINLGQKEAFAEGGWAGGHCWRGHGSHLRSCSCSALTGHAGCC